MWNYVEKVRQKRDIREKFRHFLANESQEFVASQLGLVVFCSTSAEPIRIVVNPHLTISSQALLGVMTHNFGVGRALPIAARILISVSLVTPALLILLINVPT